jgi:hypothetical protein
LVQGSGFRVPGFGFPHASHRLPPTDSTAQFQLVLHKMKISAAQFRQLFVCADFGDGPVFEDHDLVGMSDGAEAMRHYHHRFVLIKSGHIFHNGPFVVGIQSVGRLVEKQVVRVFIYRARYEQALALTLTDAVAARTDAGVEAQRQRLHKIPDIGRLYGVQQPGEVGALVAFRYVVGNGIRKNEPVLHDGTAAPAPYFGRYGFQGRFAHAQQPFLRAVKTQQQFEQGGFAAAAGAHDGRHFAGRNVEADAVQHILAQCVVAKMHLVEIQAGAGRVWRQPFVL